MPHITVKHYHEGNNPMPVLGSMKRVLTVFFSEIESDFYEKNETFFEDEEGYELAKANVPSHIREEVKRLVDNHSHMDKATHILFLDN